MGRHKCKHRRIFKHMATIVGGPNHRLDLDQARAGLPLLRSVYLAAATPTRNRLVSF
jgi:hypothetical protein